MRKKNYGIKQEDKDSRRFWIIFGMIYIILNVISVSLLFTDYNFKNDEVGKYLLISKSIAYDEKIEGNSKTSEFYPGIISCALILNKLFGLNEPQQIVFTIKTAHVLLVNLAFIFLFLLGRQLFNKEVGLLAASYLCFMSYWLTENRHFMMDTPSTMLITASAYFLFSGIERDSLYRILASGALLVFAFMTKFPTAAFGLSFMIVFLTSKLSLQRKVKLAAMFMGAVAIMLALYAILDYFTKGTLAGSLLQTFRADFNTDLTASSAPLYFVPVHFYLLSITTFLYPLLVFLGFGCYQLFRTEKMKLLHLLLFVLPLTTLLSLMTWKESRYIIPVIPFFILLGAYGMQSFFSGIEPRKDYIKVALVLLGLSFLLLGFGWAKANIFVRMNYQTEVTEYGKSAVDIIKIFFAAAVLSSIFLLIKRDSARYAKSAYAVCSVILVIGVMPHAILAEAFGKDAQPKCARLIVDNLELIGSKRVSSATPCAVPKFYFTNKTERFTVPDSKGMTSKKLNNMAEQILSTDYFVGNVKLQNTFETVLASKGSKLVCEVRQGDFCIFSVESLGFRKASIIEPAEDNLFLVDVKKNYDSYFIYKEESRLTFAPDVKKGRYALMYKQKSDGPPPLQTVLEIKSKNASQKIFLQIQAEGIWESVYQDLGERDPPLSIKWTFMNDTAVFDEATGRWVNDRNLYIKDIKLIEVLQ